tara:strand:+ start:18329 stop:19357 length:1029 start_codon:yes stop_codon:yes gene_type:complete
MKTAVITGVTGQDGAYLAKTLLDKNYRVVGLFRRTSSVNFWRIENLGVIDHPNLTLEEHDMLDMGSSIRVLKKWQPNEVYNLAAQSFVGVSFEQPILTSQVSGLGALNLLEAIRICDPSIRFYQASTSEMFGNAQEVAQNEETPFHPRSPYAVAKLLAHWSTVNYRESYGMFAASGILFNHESPLRGEEFVTRKITSSLARIASGSKETLELGNLDAKRDWGYAGDFVEGIWRILQAENPETFVLSTGKTHSVRDFLTLSANYAGFKLVFSGSGVDEQAIDASSGRVIATVSPDFFRPAEVEVLLGDSSKARNQLGWEHKVSLEQLSKMMVDHDMKISGNRP